MTVGAATVHMPAPGGPLPEPISYEPPKFASCIARLRVTSQGSSAGTLRTECEREYAAIQRRILNFLIVGYWLREEAVRQHAFVSGSEVKNKFAEERRVNYPTQTSFRRLERASRQTTADLEFAVKTRLLSARLLKRFARIHPNYHTEQATVAAFNNSIRSKWSSQTSCAPGFVISDCKEYGR